MWLGSDMDAETYAARWPVVGDVGYRWNPRNPISVAYRQQQEREIIRAVSTIPGWPDIDLLDLGCGGGQKLRYLAEIGVGPDRLHGIDMVPERIELANATNPAIDCRLGDGAELPWPDGSFDVVTQFAVFSTIPVDQRPAVAGELLRVLRPGGHILWFDLVAPNPGETPSGMPMGDIEALLPSVRWGRPRKVHHRLLARTARWRVNDLLEVVLPRTNLIVVGRV